MAIRIDADGDQYTRTTNLPPITGGTICGWLQIVTDRNDYSCPFELSDNTTNNFVYIETTADGTTLTTHKSIGGVEIISSTLVAATVGTWYFLAMTFTAASVIGYAAAPGATSLTTASAVIAGSFTPTLLRFGDSVWAAEWWNGRLAAFKLWDAVLTAAELLNEMSQILPMRTTNLNSFYPFFGAADDEIDYSGNGNTLTVGGTITTEEGPPVPWALGRRRRVVRYPEDVPPPPAEADLLLYLAEPVIGGSTFS